MNEDILSMIKKHKIIAILRGIPKEKTADVAQAFYEGGIRLLEITFNQKLETRLADTTEAIRLVKERLGTKILVGAGTVMTVEEVHAAKAGGADFSLMPNVDRAVIKEMLSLGIEAIPGAMSPSEIADAYRWGGICCEVISGRKSGTSLLQGGYGAYQSYSYDCGRGDR